MRSVGILGIPMDLGAGRRGVDMGPSALRYAQLHQVLAALGYRVTDYGDLASPVAESLATQPGLPHLEAIAQVCQAAIDQLLGWPSECFPLVLGGDHSVALGSVIGSSRGQRTGLIWLDAHGDFNTPQTSPSGNIHGMPLAALCGLGEPRLVNLGWPGAKILPSDVTLIGVRSLDSGEIDLLRSSGVTVHTMRDIDTLGLATLVEQTLARLAVVERLHVSLDADLLDPEVAPGVGTPVPGGLTYREAHLLMELLADSGRVTSADLVEVNPILDRENRTARLMVELVASLLGKRIF